jgi:hypothetical protein
MIMNTTGRRESLGSGKNHLMFREDGLEVLWHKGCLSFLYGMELGNNTRMTFFEQLFHAMGTNDLRGTDGDALEGGVTSVGSGDIDTRGDSTSSSETSFEMAIKRFFSLHLCPGNYLSSQL